LTVAVRSRTIFAMIGNSLICGEYSAVNRRALMAYGIVLTAAILGLVSWFALTGKPLLAFLPAAVVVAFLLVTHPKCVLFQFVFVLFIQVAVTWSVPLFLTDLSALLVILGAAFDILTDDRLPARLPRLTLNFLALLTAVFLAALFGYSPSVSLHPLARIGLLFITFMAVYRLAARVPAVSLVKWFYWICAGHALIALGGFVASAGLQRSYGLSPATFGDLAMIALPIGISLFLWSPKGKAGAYLVGTLIVMGGLLATQSRLSMLFALGFSLVVLVLSLRCTRRVETRTAAQASPGTLAALPGLVFGRAGTVVALASAGMLMLLFFRPGIMDAVTARFANLLSSTPSETIWLRLGLWKFAWSAFADNPLLGIGPGCFRSIHFIIPTVHLETVSVWVRGLSAHNLFLHYLAETGIVGAIALVALFANQYRLARLRWKTVSSTEDGGLTLALYVTSLLFLVTTFIEAGWLWGQTGFAFVFFAAIIVRYSANQNDHHGHSGS